MTAVDTRCLASQQEDPLDDVDSARTRLTDMLKCASLIGCSQAVTCSDDAVVRLRQLIGRATPDG